MTPLFAFALAACGALPNPKPTNLPAVWQPPPRPPAATHATAPSAESKPAPEIETKPLVPDGKQPAVSGASSSTGAGSPSSTTVATVGGKPIEFAELLAQWMHKDSFEVIKQMNHLVVVHLVNLEVERLGITVDTALSDKAYKQSVAEFERQIAAEMAKANETAKTKKPALSLDDYVTKYLGLDAGTFRQHLRAESEHALDAERAMRAHFLQNEHALARLIAVKTEDELNLAQAELSAGTAFEDVARKHSVDASGKDGGRITPILRANTAMGRLAFSVKEGEIAKPVYDQNVWLLLKVESRPKPLEGSWKEIGAAVEKSLAEHGIEDLEFSQWKDAMTSRYPVDFSPLMHAAGEPLR